MAYDAGRNQVVLFGGRTSIGGTRDTWIWDGKTWTITHPTRSPSMRIEHAMAYDAAHKQIVLFGGRISTGAAADTWLWDGKDWTQASTSAAPSPRIQHAMAYDPQSKQVILFGGGFGTINSETWAWNGKTWTQFKPAHSPPLGHARTLSYDAARGQMVLFLDSLYSNIIEVWTWNGKDWAKQNVTSSPPQRQGYSMAYDAARKVTLLFGGQVSLSPMSDTWAWNGKTWAMLKPTTSAPGRFHHRMVYDSVRQQIVLFGGTDTPDTWVWDGKTWLAAQRSTFPRAREGHAMAYDAGRKETVLFGGSDRTGPLADTWIWNSTAWQRAKTQTSPSARIGHAMAYDAARKQVILFGGAWKQTVSGETWIWNGRSWILQKPTASPSARQGHTMAYDAARQEIVLFGGWSSTKGQNAETWTWNGKSWTPRVLLKTFPSARTGQSMTYDPVRKQVILFGGHSSKGANAPLNDTWAWDGKAWIQIHPAVAPSARYSSTMVHDSAQGKILLFGGYTNSRTWPIVDDTWTWGGKSWTRLYPTRAPMPRYRHAMIYDKSNKQVLLFGGRTPWGLQEDTWVYGHLAISGYLRGFGAGCGSLPHVSIAASTGSVPKIGAPFYVTTSNIPSTSTAGIMFLGASDANLGSFTLPLSLAAFGMPGCQLYQSMDLAWTFSTKNGTGQVAIPIPNSSSLVDKNVYLQAIVLAPGSNVAQLLSSNGGTVRLGNQ